MGKEAWCSIIFLKRLGYYRRIESSSVTQRVDEHGMMPICHCSYSMITVDSSPTFAFVTSHRHVF